MSMTVAITVPSVGESITEGTIARWLKKDGEQVRADEPVLELETDKATTALPAPTGGTLHITVPEGQTVQIGAVVGEIDPAGKPSARPAANEKPAAPASDRDAAPKDARPAPPRPEPAPTPRPAEAGA